jgi:hypothetical protein
VYRATEIVSDREVCKLQECEQAGLASVARFPRQGKVLPCLPGPCLILVEIALPAAVGKRDCAFKKPSRWIHGTLYFLIRVFVIVHW